MSQRIFTGVPPQQGQRRRAPSPSWRWHTKSIITQVQPGQYIHTHIYIYESVKPTGQALKKPQDGRKFAVKVSKPRHAWTLLHTLSLSPYIYIYTHTHVCHQTPGAHCLPSTQVHNVQLITTPLWRMRLSASSVNVYLHG